jgi:hypothetical protein
VSEVSTGLRGLDKLINSLRAGDNVVWQIDKLEDFQQFVTPFVKKAVADNKTVVYIRFAKHHPLVEPGPNIIIEHVDAYSGFESFSTRVNKIIGDQGEGVYYVFDCLSELLPAWASDLMIGNFFKVTCPYLFILNTFTYFAIIRNKHSFKTVARIREITQLLIDVYHYEGNYFVHPIKVWNRYSPTMFLPHIIKKDQFIPLTHSLDVAKLFSYIGKKSPKSARRNLDYWDLLFLRAEEMIADQVPEKEKQEMANQIFRIMIGRDERVLSLAKKNMALEDLVNIKSRLIGTGFVGGKTVGMLLSRKILMNDPAGDWSQKLEPHDSFYIGSDVFYTYIVQNGWWKQRMEQKTKDGYFRVAANLKELLLTGEFPEEIQDRFREMIEYYGQSPIIVRSSSLLEDAFGNAFAGKYESVFCANQGAPEERYKQFTEVVKQVYASTMNVDALTYRLQRGLDQQDEQMALLVQRVSGAYHKSYFFPDLAGVGISYNTFVWKNNMDPKAGMLRLVCGLGTRAVNRVEGDYPRIVALDAPFVKPHAGIKDTQRFSQHYVDLINVRENKFDTVAWSDLINEKLDLDLDLFAVRDEDADKRWQESGKGDREFWIITLDELLANKHFTETMKKMLKILEKAYHYPVDTEFTVNFKGRGIFGINLLQCRPHQTRGLGKKVALPAVISKEKTVFSSRGYFVGGNTSLPVKRIIFVDPEKYDKLPVSAKYDVARVVGTLNRQIVNKEELPVLLMGPGRWGTSTPSMGVPVSFAEINNIAALCEISFVSGNTMPEISFGTHFFQDLVETNIFYMALLTDNKETVFNKNMLTELPNLLEKLAPEYKKYKETVRVSDVQALKLRLMADIISQKVILFAQ